MASLRRNLVLLLFFVLIWLPGCFLFENSDDLIVARAVEGDSFSDAASYHFKKFNSSEDAAAKALWVKVDRPDGAESQAFIIEGDFYRLEFPSPEGGVKTKTLPNRFSPSCYKIDIQYPNTLYVKVYLRPDARFLSLRPEKSSSVCFFSQISACSVPALFLSFLVLISLFALMLKTAACGFSKSFFLGFAVISFAAAFILPEILSADFFVCTPISAIRLALAPLCVILTLAYLGDWKLSSPAFLVSSSVFEAVYLSGAFFPVQWFYVHKYFILLLLIPAVIFIFKNKGTTGAVLSLLFVFSICLSVFFFHRPLVFFVMISVSLSAYVLKVFFCLSRKRRDFVEYRHRAETLSESRLGLKDENSKLHARLSALDGIRKTYEESAKKIFIRQAHIHEFSRWTIHTDVVRSDNYRSAVFVRESQANPCAFLVSCTSEDFALSSACIPYIFGRVESLAFQQIKLSEICAQIISSAERFSPVAFSLSALRFSGELVECFNYENPDFVFINHRSKKCSWISADAFVEKEKNGGQSFILKLAVDDSIISMNYDALTFFGGEDKALDMLGSVSSSDALWKERAVFSRADQISTACPAIIAAKRK